jgi:tetratricopeptide (TPR) repeat protein
MMSLIAKLLPYLDKTAWPEDPTASELGRRAYEVGLDKADEFRDDPLALAAALSTFQSGQSRPYALAGVAYVLVRASVADPAGGQEALEAALAWLERAQELTPDLAEINFIEALIYLQSGRPDDARTVLDYLAESAPPGFHLCAAEAAYWQAQGDLDRAVAWYHKGSGTADSVPRRLRLRVRLADCYLEYREYEKAAELYREAVHFSRDDARLWHALSLAYFGLERYVESSECNRKALELLEFAEARELQLKLREKLGSNPLRALTGRLKKSRV